MVSFYEQIAFSLIGTHLQRPAQNVRRLLGALNRWRHPELKELYLEGDRTHELIERTITDGMNCIDIGCHLGSVLNQILRLSPHGRHIAVEPLPYKAAWLHRRYPQVQVHQIALGEEDGQVEFFYNRRQSGFSGLRPHCARDGQQQLEKIGVRCRRLDDVVPGDHRIGFIKLDVEGAELKVLRGASRILVESKPLILFECTRSGLEAFDFSACNVFSFLTDLRYRIFLIKDWLAGNAPLDLLSFEESMKYPFQAFNYVAAPSS